MTAQQIIFLIVALFTLGSALMVVTTRNLVHAALWLVSTLFGGSGICTFEREFYCGSAGGRVYRRYRHSSSSLR